MTPPAPPPIPRTSLAGWPRAWWPRAWPPRAWTMVRVLVLAGALVLTGFAGLCGSLLVQAHRETRANADHAALNIARAVARDVERNTELLDLALRATADAAAEAAGRPDVTALPDALRRRVLFGDVARACYLGLTLVIAADGTVVARSDGSAAALGDVRGREYFAWHRDHPGQAGLHVSRPFASMLTGEPSVAMSRRLPDVAGGFGGVVVCVVRLAYFEDLFARLDVGSHGTIALLDADGTILAVKPAAGPLGTRVGGDVRARLRGVTGGFDALGPADGAVDGAVDGAARSYVYQRADNAPLLVLVGTSPLDVYASWYRWALALVIALAALMVVGGAVVWLLAREMRRRAKAERVTARSQAWFRMLADKSSDAIILRDAAGARTYASPSFYQMIGWAPEALGDRKLAELLHPEDRGIPADTLRRLSAGEDTVTEVLRCQRQDGGWIWLECRVSAVRDAEGPGLSFISNMRDVSARRAAEEELARAAARLAVLATTDKLTGLANRRRFDEVLETEWARAQRGGMPLALLLIDADQFKAFNDLYGHQRGDGVLQGIAACIGGYARRPADLAARYGGEEFALLLPDITEAQAMGLAERIRGAVEARAIPHGGCAGGWVTISVGVACLTPARAEAGVGAATLVGEADAALYEAKRAGRNRSVCLGSARPGPPCAAVSRMGVAA